MIVFYLFEVTDRAHQPVNRWHCGPRFASIPRTVLDGRFRRSGILWLDALLEQRGGRSVLRHSWVWSVDPVPGPGCEIHPGLSFRGFAQGRGSALLAALHSLPAPVGKKHDKTATTITTCTAGHDGLSTCIDCRRLGPPVKATLTQSVNWPPSSGVGRCVPPFPVWSDRKLRPAEDPPQTLPLSPVEGEMR